MEDGLQITPIIVNGIEYDQSLSILLNTSLKCIFIVIYDIFNLND